MKVLHITDPHLKGDPAWRLGGLDPSLSYEAVLSLLRPRMAAVDLVLATGDIGHDGDVDAYRRFRADFEAFGKPTLVLPGNHDDVSTLQDVFPADALISCRTEYQQGGWRFLALNSQISGQVGGRIGDGQLAWLEGQLGRYPDTPTLVALHHHPISIGAAWLDEQRVADGEALLECLRRHPQVQVLLWGHIHQEVDQNDSNAAFRMLATPSTSIQFKPGSTDFALDPVAPGVRWLELGKDGSVVTQVERIEGQWKPDPAVTGYD